MLRILRRSPGSQRNDHRFRFIVIAGKELPIIDLLQLHAVVVHDPVWRDRTATARYKRPGHRFAIQHFQFIDLCAAAMQIHVVLTANGGKV